MTANGNPAMLTVPEVAREMQVGTSTVYRLVSVNGGPIPSIRLGYHTIRVPRLAFEQWLANHSKAGAS